ncbi:hypothetical protein F4703DRAFT_1825227 [Phycomyces blakesleeanus]
MESTSLTTPAPVPAPVPVPVPAITPTPISLTVPVPATATTSTSTTTSISTSISTSTSTSASVSAVSGRPEPHIVRIFWLSHILGVWQRVSRINQYLLILSITITIIEIVVSVVMLIVGQHETCDKPLDLFLIVFVVRAGVVWPFDVRQRIKSALNTQVENSEHVSKDWADRAKYLLDLFSILWFIVGNYFLFTSDNCSTDAPRLYYTILVWTIFGYLIVLIPTLLCISAIFCLPSVLHVMRLLHLYGIDGLNQGATDTEIQDMITLRYRTSEDGSDTHQAEKSIDKRRRWFSRLGFGQRKQIQDTEVVYDTITFSQQQQQEGEALCAVCLADYEDNDLICKLWCSHHFHKDCVQQWLKLNRKCPMCKQDFQGKNLSQDED